MYKKFNLYMNILDVTDKTSINYYHQPTLIVAQG